MAKVELMQARALIESGWTTGALKQKNEDGVMCYCLDGAIAESHGFDAANDAANDIYGILERNRKVYADVKLVSEQLADVGFLWNYEIEKKHRVVQSLWRFNDTYATKELVLKALDAAIEKAE